MRVQNEMQITFMTFFIKDLNTIKQTQTKNIILRLIKASKKEPDHVELNDLNDYSNNYLTLNNIYLNMNNKGNYFANYRCEMPSIDQIKWLSFETGTPILGCNRTLSQSTPTQ